MIRRLWSSANLVLILLIAVPMACLAQTPMAVTASGPVQELEANAIDIFRDIPFAAPPVGALRWRAPQSTEKWNAAMQAANAGPDCMQTRGMSFKNGGDPGKLDEDCLYLNVFSPRVERTARFPGMLWIVGGALIFGSGGILLARPVFDEAEWAKGNLDTLFVISTVEGVGDLVDADATWNPLTSTGFL